MTLTDANYIDLVLTVPIMPGVKEEQVFPSQPYFLCLWDSFII